MQLYPALFTTREGATTALCRATERQNTPLDLGRVKPIYRRGQLLGYHAIYPRKGGGFDVVKETFDGSHKCYHLN
jgi:hypothetical protein